MIAEHAAAAGRRVGIDDVCAVAVSSAQASGAWVVAASSRGPDFVMSVTDQVSEQLAELQQMLGEGPCHDVLTAAAPVLAADLRDTGIQPPVASVRTGSPPHRAPPPSLRSRW